LLHHYILALWWIWLKVILFIFLEMAA